MMQQRSQARTVWSEMPQVAKRVALSALAGLSIAALAAHAALAEDNVVSAHGISTFGELKYPEGFAHFDYVNPDAPKGGEFSTWAFGTFDSLTPYILKGNAAIGSSLFYDTLMVSNLEEPDAQYGLLAHRIEYPESREWVIFHLREEATFRDGTSVRAEDVVFSYDILKEKGRPTFKTVFRFFESAEVIDDLTVKFTFDPEGPLRELILTAGGLPVFSKAYYETHDFEESSLEPPMGSGPYDLASIDAGRDVVYQRRDDYWAKDLPMNVGKDNFDTIRFEYYADYTAALEAFKGGAYLYREEFTSKDWATQYDFPAIRDGYVKKESLPDGRPAGTQGFWFNLRREKFQDIRLRQALGMAFNFEWSNESLFYDSYKRTDSFWENSSTLQAEGEASAEEISLLEPLAEFFPDTLLSESAYVPAVSSAANLADRKQLRRAGKLLDEAGWTVADDGLRYKDGELLTVEFLTDSPGFDRIILPYVENLKRLGVDAKLERVDAAEAQEREKRFDYDIVVQRFSMSQTPGDELRQIFGSETANTLGSVNVAGLQNEGVDQLVKIVAEAKSREELTVAVKALDRALRTLHIWVPQWHKGSFNIAYRDVYSRPYEDTPPQLGLGSSTIWWWDEDKAEKLKDQGAL